MKVLRTTLTLIALVALFLPGQTYADADAGEEEELDLSGDDMTVAEEETVELDDSWLPIDSLGADLACSACELVVDRLTAQMRTAEYAAKAAAEKEANEKKKDEEEAAKEDTEKEETDKKEENDGGKKKKDKKKKDKKKKEKKKSEVKVDKKLVAETVLQHACNRTNFLGLNVIGSYPGRQYQIGGSALTTPESKKILLACQYFLKEEGTTAYLAKTLAGNGKSKIKKMKRNVCERRAKVCKSAALGFEAESSCLMKAMRAFDRGDFEKAKKHAGDCSETEV